LAARRGRSRRQRFGGGAESGAHPYTPFMFSIVTPLQVPTSDFDVGGLRINAIYRRVPRF
jgi:hypothetical protein